MLRICKCRKELNPLFIELPPSYTGPSGSAARVGACRSYFFARLQCWRCLRRCSYFSLGTPRRTTGPIDTCSSPTTPGLSIIPFHRISRMALKPQTIWATRNIDAGEALTLDDQFCDDPGDVGNVLTEITLGSADWNDLDPRLKRSFRRSHRQTAVKLRPNKPNCGMLGAITS